MLSPVGGDDKQAGLVRQALHVGYLSSSSVRVLISFAIPKFAIIPVTALRRCKGTGSAGLLGVPRHLAVAE